jgi:hypothetical protein
MSTDVAWLFALGVIVLRGGLVAAGTVLCVCGYRLFERAHAPATAEFALGKVVRVHLMQVAPGIFFSLFGCALLVYGIHSPPVLRLDEEPQRRAVVVAGAIATRPASGDRAALLRAQPDRSSRRTGPTSSASRRAFDWR